MKISNNVITIEVSDSSLNLYNHDLQESITLDWPAVSLGLHGQCLFPAKKASLPVKENNTISQAFTCESITCKVSVSLSDSCWFIKSVELITNEDLPTVDYLDVDYQTVDDPEMRICGYRATSQDFPMEPQAEEEASGKMPGCGYPIVGRRFFLGLEHPAAFNKIDYSGDNQTVYSLRHYPQWSERKLEQVNAVFGWSRNPCKSFADYLDTIRIPRLVKPLISYCTFWSDPYIGNYEYDVKYDNYMSFFTAFFELGLRPDIFTLDAGWNDRMSIFQAKDSVKRDSGLLAIRDYIRKYGAELSLWLSHNGPMGVAPEYMQECGFSTGGGNSAAYCMDGSGIMMDSEFEKALSQRFCQLVEKIEVVHYKIDWDNECATNSSFTEKYPTTNHVRQASLNAMFRISHAMRRINPNIIIRNGWWVSPWWLMYANHLWLCQSGDSEFASLPAANQRESASTHRDLMYYNILCRDKSLLPLDCFDNHEFADGLRNPFVETPVSWTNAVWLSFFRGSTYLAYTLQPESLEDWQVDSLKKITEFCRIYANKIFVSHGRMVLGNPGHGEVYGFIQPGENQSWCLLRNPLPAPQMVTVKFDTMVTHEAVSIKQFYPCYDYLKSGELTFAAHEIKILVIDRHEAVREFDVPFMVEQGKRGYKYNFPTSLNFNDQIRPLVNETYQIHQMKFDNIEKKMTKAGLEICFSLTALYRLRELNMQVHVKGKDSEKVDIKIYISRQEKAKNNCYALPVTVILDNLPGYGETRNPDSSPQCCQKFFNMVIPDGGTSNYRMLLIDFDPKHMDFDIWASGYEAPSRNTLTHNKEPMGFKKCLPFQHPLGFPVSIKL